MSEKTTSVAKSKFPELVSYLALRKAVGIIGVSLPIVLFVGTVILGHCCHIQGSISKYYHTVMQNVFVGSLCAVALFLWTYKGYAKKEDDKKMLPGDNVAGNLAALFALGVAFFPTRITVDDLTQCITVIYDREIIGKLHLFWAFLFFCTLAYYSLILFTKGENRSKNRLFRICGYTILGCILLIILYIFLLKKPFPQLAEIKPIFWLETFALWAFGISWLTKGNLIVREPIEKNE